MVAYAALPGVVDAEVTVPARKMIDICRALPPESDISFEVEGERAIIRCGRSRFKLTTLPASSYPNTDDLVDAVRVAVEGAALKSLLELTQFAMAHQDVRYYLNGLLLEVGPQYVRAVATDGHRLALSELQVESKGLQEGRQIIVPRKAIGELTRLLGAEDEEAVLEIGANVVRVTLADVCMTSKLIEGRFPDYERVIPDVEDCSRRFKVSKEEFRQCLTRASILANEKYRAVRFSLAPGVLRVMGNNPEQEASEDEIAIDFDGSPLEVGFNVAYLMDALGALPTDVAEVYLTDSSGSCLLMAKERRDCQYVVMPMRL